MAPVTLQQKELYNVYRCDSRGGLGPIGGQINFLGSLTLATTPYSPQLPPTQIS